MNELIFHNFNAAADGTGGDMMLVLTETSTIDEIAQYILFNVEIDCAQTSTLWAIAAEEGNKTSLPASFIVNVAFVELVRIVMYLPLMAAPFRAPPEVVKYCFTLSSFM